MAPSVLVPASLSSAVITLKVSGPGSHGFFAISPKRFGSDVTGSQVNGYLPTQNRKISEGVKWATWLVHADLHCVPSRYKRAASLITRSSSQSPASPDQNGSAGSAGGGGEDSRGVLKALSLFKSSGRSGPTLPAAPDAAQAEIETELYTLKWRELVSMVAAREGVSVSVLRKLNPGVDLDHVRSKQQIAIPKRRDVGTGTVRSDALPTPLPPPAAPSPEMRPALCPPAAPPSDLSSTDVASHRGREGGGLGAALGSVVRKMKGVSPGKGPLHEVVETAAYRFRRGDRLSALAREWGMSEDHLLALNPTLSGERLKAGTIIMVPKENLQGGRWEQGGDGRGGRLEADGSRSCMIQPADCLLTVARRYGVSVDDIVQANGLVENERIRVGQVFTIPEPKGVIRLTTAQLAASGLPGYLGVPTRTFQMLAFASVLVAVAARGWLVARSEARKGKGNAPLTAVAQRERGGQDLAIHLNLPRGTGGGLGQVAGTSGWGKGVTLEVAFEEAFGGAAEVAGNGNADLIIANAGPCLPSEPDTSLPQVLGFLEEKVEGGGQLLGMAASGGREAGALFSASVLLLETPGRKAATCSVGVGEAEAVEAAVQRAAEGLASGVSPQGLKSVVACVCLDHEPAVQRELALLFPNLSIYTVTCNEGANRPDWFVSEGGGELPQARPSCGLSLIGVPTEAAYQGADLACVIGQWLYGGQLRLCAHAPTRNVGDERVVHI